MTRLKQIDVAATGKRIMELRESSGISARELTDMMGLTIQAYYRWVHGDVLPTVDNLVILADIFGVKMDDIIVAG